MAEINLHPDDTVMSGTEVAKKAGGTLAGLLFFEAMFYACLLYTSPSPRDED